MHCIVNKYNCNSEIVWKLWKGKRIFKRYKFIKDLLVLNAVILVLPKLVFFVLYHGFWFLYWQLSSVYFRFLVFDHFESQCKILKQNIYFDISVSMIIRWCIQIRPSSQQFISSHYLVDYEFTSDSEASNPRLICGSEKLRLDEKIATMIPLFV